MSDFEEANKTIHKVEDQWHYPILKKYGFVPVTKEKAGFVRSYEYKKGDHIVTASTGVNADHWRDNKGNLGFWMTLESSLKKKYEKL